MPKKYRWRHPREWLDDVRARRDTESGFMTDTDILNSVIDTLDGDTIQDIFQSEMDRDGYFDEAED